MNGTPARRVLAAPWIGLVLLLVAAPLHAEEGDPPPGELRALEAYLENQEYRKALAECEARLESEPDLPDLHALAARCALRAGLYDEALEHSRGARRAIQRLEERTEESRTLAKELVELENEVERIRSIRKSLIPKIVSHLILYLPWWGEWLTLDRSRYLGEAEWDHEQHWYDRILKDEYASPHLYVLFRGGVGFKPVVVLVESYADEDTARKRYEQVQKNVVRQRPKWQRHYAERRKVRGTKLEQVTEDREPYRDRHRWVLARTWFGWKSKEGPPASDHKQVVVTLLNFLSDGETKPRPEAWYHIVTLLDSNEMDWVRDR